MYSGLPTRADQRNGNFQTNKNSGSPDVYLMSFLLCNNNRQYSVWVFLTWKEKNVKYFWQENKALKQKSEASHELNDDEIIGRKVCKPNNAGSYFSLIWLVFFSLNMNIKIIHCVTCYLCRWGFSFYLVSNKILTVSCLRITNKIQR